MLLSFSVRKTNAMQDDRKVLEMLFEHRQLLPMLPLADVREIVSYVVNLREYHDHLRVVVSSLPTKTLAAALLSVDREGQEPTDAAIFVLRCPPDRQRAILDRMAAIAPGERLAQIHAMLDDYARYTRGIDILAGLKGARRIRKRTTRNSLRTSATIKA